MDLKTYLSEERGRASKLADTLGVSSATISEWATGRKQVPAERCTEIEDATSRSVLCEELRPDLVRHWDYLRRSPLPAKHGEVA